MAHQAANTHARAWAFITSNTGPHRGMAAALLGGRALSSYLLQGPKSGLKCNDETDGQNLGICLRSTRFPSRVNSAGLRQFCNRERDAALSVAQRHLDVTSPQPDWLKPLARLPITAMYSAKMRVVPSAATLFRVHIQPGERQLHARRHGRRRLHRQGEVRALRRERDDRSRRLPACDAAVPVYCG